jgi:hypothetical protein
MYCTNCSEELTEDSNFCTECGEEVKINNDNKSNKSQEESDKEVKEKSKTKEYKQHNSSKKKNKGGSKSNVDSTTLYLLGLFIGLLLAAGSFYLKPHMELAFAGGFFVIILSVLGIILEDKIAAYLITFTVACELILRVNFLIENPQYYFELVIWLVVGYFWFKWLYRIHNKFNT